MFMSVKVLEALAVLRDAAENDFERHRIDKLVHDLTSPPAVEKIDDTHQRFNDVVYTKNKRGYFDCANGLHRMVWSYCNGEIPLRCQIHHIDENPSNNNPVNLQLLTKEEHRRLHRKFDKEKVCPICGKIFTNTSHNRACCSLSCSAKMREREKRKPPMEKICKTCGKSFSTRKKTQLYCSRECKPKNNWNGYPSVEKCCRFCGEKFISQNPQKIYCSKNCKSQMHEKNRIVTKTCPVCGINFTARRKSAIYCSRACANKINNQASVEKRKTKQTTES